jgi:hypothetical protein
LNYLRGINNKFGKGYDIETRVQACNIRGGISWISRKSIKRSGNGLSMAAIIIGVGISSRLGIYGQKFISVDTALSIVIIAGTAMVLNKMAINIADKWYAGNRNKE